MFRKSKFFIKIIVVILLIVFVIGGGYLFNYINYSNKDIVELSVLKEENRILREEIKKNEKIYKINDEYVIARVILRDIHNFYNEIMINAGKDKVSVGDAVINEDGLIGIISKVNSDTSYVKLIGSGINLSVKVDDTYGNLKGNKVDLLDKYSEFNEGDLIYTSGLTNIPEGIYVGKIKKVKMDENNLGKEVIISLVDNSNLVYVGVISSIK